jgi:hypothetical protein
MMYVRLSGAWTRAMRPFGDLNTPFTVTSLTSIPAMPGGRAPAAVTTSPARPERLMNGSRRPAGSYE